MPVEVRIGSGNAVHWSAIRDHETLRIKAALPIVTVQPGNTVNWAIIREEPPASAFSEKAPPTPKD